MCIGSCVIYSVSGEFISTRRSEPIGNIPMALRDTPERWVRYTNANIVGKKSMIDLERPLFIPLKTEFYNQFIWGEKDTEFRKYGARWNELTCPPMRPVILSKGYGKKFRRSGVISRFNKTHIDKINPLIRESLKALYPDGIEFVACIGVKLDDEE